ncbi:uncharacterized protein MKK02DRAFT_33022 [Dioszegia hungarica]|uniref:Uncharacterized protein n=1 Tax=Dioszegia hungarica TaxID=4972 RepID=A0AA38H7V3_9TREE|nr:uncharacterized protein MKK02DRAFT_33022 [Dioszegia hungarica]KAI9635647.1 hypothetical protein MKK02DRAFT_33022 [Dioszegia hungarica]
MPPSRSSNKKAQAALSRQLRLQIPEETTFFCKSDNPQAACSSLCKTLTGLRGSIRRYRGSPRARASEAETERFLLETEAPLGTLSNLLTWRTKCQADHKILPTQITARFTTPTSEEKNPDAIQWELIKANECYILKKGGTEYDFDPPCLATLQAGQSITNSVVKHLPQTSTTKWYDPATSVLSTAWDYSQTYNPLVVAGSLGLLLLGPDTTFNTKVLASAGLFSTLGRKTTMAVKESVQSSLARRADPEDHSKWLYAKHTIGEANEGTLMGDLVSALLYQEDPEHWNLPPRNEATIDLFEIGEASDFVKKTREAQDERVKVREQAEKEKAERKERREDREADLKLEAKLSGSSWLPWHWGSRNSQQSRSWRSPHSSSQQQPPRALQPPREHVELTYNGFAPRTG